jgi:creatinine amidohydrolase
MAPLRFEEMRPDELEAAVAECPLAWVPVGTLEWHGRHLPVGLDALKAHALCLRCAERAGGVVLPPSYHSMLGMMFPWTFRYPPRVLRDTMMTTWKFLNEYGFRSIITVTGHYPPTQVAALMALAHEFMRRSDTMVLAVPEFAMAPESRYCGDHAAKWETSILMELRPELVNREKLEEIKGLRGFALWKHGIQGRNPGDAASRETGRAVVEEMVENFSVMARKMLLSRDQSLVREFHASVARRFFTEHAARFKSLVENAL